MVVSAVVVAYQNAGTPFMHSVEWNRENNSGVGWLPETASFLLTPFETLDLPGYTCMYYGPTCAETTQYDAHLWQTSTL